jgi:NADPH:quinone reductase-like Zn-dependent oxidoreductase
VWLTPLPEGIDLAQAAALPVAGITAWQALHHVPSSVHSTAC